MDISSYIVYTVIGYTCKRNYTQKVLNFWLLGGIIHSMYIHTALVFIVSRPAGIKADQQFIAGLLLFLRNTPSRVGLLSITHCCGPFVHHTLLRAFCPSHTVAGLLSITHCCGPVADLFVHQTQPFVHHTLLCV